MISFFTKAFAYFMLAIHLSEEAMLALKPMLPLIQRMIIGYNNYQYYKLHLIYSALTIVLPAKQFRLTLGLSAF